MFTDAKREQINLSIAISGATGTGKTIGSLRLAYGLAGGDWSKVYYIQTEAKSPTAYIGDTRWQVGTFKHARITAPFDPTRIKMMLERAYEDGAAVVILDSISQMWSGSGGTYHQQQALGGAIGDWQKVNPQWYETVDWLTNPPIHVIVTMRAKMEYAMKKDGDSWSVERLGLGPEVRPKTEYEFYTFLMLGTNYMAKVASATGNLLPDLHQIELTEGVGEYMKDWAENGEDTSMLIYGDRTIVDVLATEHEIATFLAYQETTGKPPYNRDVARSWYKSNKEGVADLIEQRRKQFESELNGHRHTNGVPA